MLENAIASIDRSQRIWFAVFLTLFGLMLPQLASAAVTGVEFQAAYDFIFNAATGYLGRAISIVGGVIGLGIGAATGRALPAIIGIVLAIFGALGPAIINTIFAGAII